MPSKVFWYLRFLQLFIYVSLGSSDETAQDCMDLLEKGFRQDGVYVIDPDNQGPFQVFCDQTTKGGGWVVFQKRFDGSEDFYRNWSDYKNGFGRLNGEFWLGNDKIHRLTNRHQELLVELEDFHDITAHAQYDYFSVDSEEDWYKLHLGAYSGNAGNSLIVHHSMKFSTNDKDNDMSEGNCTHQKLGAWWFNACATVNLNGNYTENWAPIKSNVYWRSFKGDYPMKSTSMKVRGTTGAEWDYSIELSTNGNLAHAQISKLTKLNKLTVCWWMKLLTTELTQPFTVFSIDEPSLNNSFAFSIQGYSAFRLTVNATDHHYFLPELNIFDNRWHYMCVRGPYNGLWLFSVGLRRIKFTVRPKGLDIQPGSILRIGIFSENSIGGVQVRETVIGHLSHMNIWDVKKDFTFLRETSRSCSGPMGTVIPWSVVQFWLHDTVAVNSPSECTSADNIHWSLSTADKKNIADDSSLWQGNVVGDGVDLDTNVMSFQGGGHVILGSFADRCPGIPSLCEDGFTVSFWMKHGVKFTSYIFGQNEKYHEALESMVSAVTPSNGKWTRCYHARSDGFTAHAFHSRCDNKGPTITLVQAREFIFGGFLDQNWGGPSTRYISSSLAFLFSINNVLGLQPFKIDVKQSNKTFAAFNDPYMGPVFGLNDLTIAYNDIRIPRESESHIGNAYSLPEGFDDHNEVHGFGLLAETRVFTWDDFEVFYYDVPHQALEVADPAVVPDSAFDSSSERVSQEYSANKSLLNTEGEWCAHAHYSDKQQWLQAKIGSNDPPVGKILVTMSKPTGGASWVISYLLNMSTDGKDWTALENPIGQFEGVYWSDRSYAFNPRPSYLRFLPQTWNSDICMKIRITSHAQEIFLEMTASSERCMAPPHFARLNLPGLCLSAWCSKPRSEDPHPWLRVSLATPQYILFVATQGTEKNENKYFVLSYYLSFIDADDGKWKNYTENGKMKIFEGNWDASTVVKNAILRPFKTRTLKFHIDHCNSEQCCLRVEIYGPECQRALGMESGEISDYQINASSEWGSIHAAIYGRLHPVATPGRDGAVWSSAVSDANQWLQVDLGPYTSSTITRVATQGRDDDVHRQWVTKYKLQYSNDGINFQYYKEPGQTTTKIFAGNTDWNSVVSHDLNASITARYIRFRPIEWHLWISMRVELYGCRQVCNATALGMESGAILDSQISASTEYSDQYLASYGRLNYEDRWAWSSLKNDPDQWLQIDVNSQHISVVRIATQGNQPYLGQEYVTTYKLQYGNDGQVFYYYREQGESRDKIFAGNTDAFIAVLHDLNPPITARFIRFRPVSWVEHISMRVEVYGCQSVMKAFGCSPMPLGMESGRITDSQITASSEIRDTMAAIYGRLNFQDKGGGWASFILDANQWLEVDLDNELTSVMSVATQGRTHNGYYQYVKLYKLQYSNDKANFLYHREQGQTTEKIFAGNTDADTVVSHDLNPPITARYIRFRPIAWFAWVSMRVELYGCIQEKAPYQKDLGTIVSWRSKNTILEDKKEFEFKQVKEFFSSYHQLAVTSGDKVYKLNIPTIPRTWQHVTFTWSKAWGLKFYQNGVLVAETGRTRKMVTSATNPTDGLFIIGNRLLSNEVKSVHNFQMHDLTVWPRIVSQAQIREEVETVACRMTDWCLKPNSYDDFDWSFGKSCTKTQETGPCTDADFNNEVHRSFSNVAFKGNTQQHPSIGNLSSLAVDGDLNTRSELGPDSNPWWKVDLGRDGLVTGVRLALIVNSYGGDPGIVIITVANETGDSGECASIDEDVVNETLVNHVVTYCDVPLLGRYVKVEMIVANICSIVNCQFSMSLYEVDVMLEQTAGFYYIEASPPRVKGDRARLITQYILPRFNCLTFYYHMEGAYMGKLSVYLESYKARSKTLLWRLFRDQSTMWQRAEIPTQSNEAYKIAFEGIVNGEEGDIAIDEVTFTRNQNCSFIPDSARSTYTADFRSDIIGHIPAYKARLESWLTSVGFQGKLWKPCYNSATDGWDSDIFHENCDEKGATLTIARFNNTIFGGFADHSWGSWPEGLRVSTKSFLFRFEKMTGHKPEELVLGLDQVFKWIVWSKEQGPTFGYDELVLSSDMRQARASELVSYIDASRIDASRVTTNESSLLRENSVSLHAIEVLTIGDSLCARQCPLYQYCDEVRGWCSWDLAFQDARFCDNAVGNSSSYWPLDNHLNMVNLRGDRWGTFVGAVGTTKGARLGAVYTSGDAAVIKLGEVHGVCFTEPMSCSSGFTVSLWLKRKTLYLYKVIRRQVILSIADNINGRFTFRLLQKSGQTEEHLAVWVLASARKCVRIFPVPRNLWSQFVFVWNTIDVNIFRNGVRVDKYLDGGYCTNETDEGTFQPEPVVTLKGDAEFDDLQIWDRALAPNEISEMFTCVRAPSWTCTISDWTKSLKTEGWSRCSGENSLMNGLRRGEYGGLEDFVDRLEGAWCCSPPSQYKHKGLECVINRYFENWNGKHGYLQCWDGKFIRGMYRTAGSRAFFTIFTNVECCKPTSHSLSYGACYSRSVTPFDTPGLAKCDDNYFITQVRVSHCRQLYCVDRLRCCKMETDERDDQGLDIRLEAKLLDEVWNPNLTDSLHYQFQNLRNKIKREIWDVYHDAKKARYVKDIVTHNFRPGSVIAFFSVIFELPYYEIITPLIEDINQTAAPNQRNYLGDMAIQLLDVEAVNVYGRSLNLTVTANNGLTLHLSWEFAEDNPNFGSFQGYQVLYSTGNDIAEDFVLAMEINDNRTQASFVGEPCEFYSFKVRAYSLEGYGKLSEAVNVVTACEVVSNVSAVGKTSSSISLQWVPVKGSLVTGFNVTYEMVSGGPTWHVTLRQSASQVDLVNLRGMTAYSIKLGLLAAHQEILWSEELFCSTLPGAPSAPPENVTAYNLSSTSVNVTWFPVPTHLLNGLLQSYRVFYREVSVKYLPTMEIAVGNTSLSVVISALKKFTVYSVWVKAITGAAGPSSVALTVSTDESVPSLPPLNVAAFNVSSTIIRVIWQPIPANNIHGVLLGYHVEYHRVHREKRSVTMVTVNATSLSVDIVGLVKFSEYRIMVSGFTGKGDGNQSEITCWTDEDVPDSPPTDITVHSNTSSVLEVLWNPVLQENRNGVIRGYHILLFDAWGESLRNETFQNSRQTYHQFQGLKAWTNYSVKVRAFTSKGNGPYSTSLLANTDEDAPLVAPTDITGHNTSSTSIRVTWQPVSPDDAYIRGIHRGYSIYYVSRDTPRPSILMNVTVDVLTTHVQLTNLHKFTKYDIHVTVRTRWDGPKSATITVSTDEGTPDLPPSGVTATTLGMTGITVRWRPVPLGYRGGIITGYRISYNSSNSTSRWRNVSGDTLYVTLTSLTKFTFYDVYVQAHTIKGNGPAHYLRTATDMGVPNEAPPGLTAENWDTTHSIVIKWQPLPPSNEYGILAGYRVRYRLTAIGEESVTDYSENELVTSPETNQVLLENLVMYGTYSVWVSAFTIKGDGPASFTYAETCRCDKHLKTNWRRLAPYVSNKTSKDAPHPGGILPGIIHDMAITCCQTCTSHGQSLVDFGVDGNGEASEKPTDSALMAKISHQTQFSFPVPGFSEQEKYGVDLGYWPLVETPGVAYVVNTGVGTSPSEVLNDTLASCWPAVLLVFVMSLLAGFVMWVLECGDNQSQFPRSITRGPGEGFWWAFVTMTTVGYGDKFAASPMARVLTVIWMLLGLVVQGLFVATVTMSLVSQSLDVDFKLYGNKIAAIQDSFEYRFGLRRNAQLNPEKLYTSYDEISAALVNGEVSGALIDTYVLGSRKDLFEKPSLRLIKIYDYSTAYGVVLGGEARKLRQCFRKYVQSHKEKIFQTIQEQVEFVEESRIPLAVERSAGLFDSESTLFETSVLLSSALLLVFLTAGSVWELAKRIKIRRRVETERDRLKLLRDNTRKEVYRTMEDFTVRIKTLAEELKTKQSKERSRLLKKLKSASLKGMKYSTTRLSMEAVLAEVDC